MSFCEYVQTQLVAISDDYGYEHVPQWQVRGLAATEGAATEG